MSMFGTNDKITVIAQIRAKSGHEGEVRKMVESLTGSATKEPGCLSYRVFEDAHYTGSFFTVEEWESEAALDTHLQVNKKALDQSKALLREDLRINVLRPLA